MSWSDPCSNCGAHRADCDCGKWGEIKAEPVESAEEIRKKYMPHGCINLKPNQENQTIISAMEEYASLRVAQEKKAWYTKLRNKLVLIQAGELKLSAYITEIRNKLYGSS